MAEEIVYVVGCPKCGGQLDTIPGFSGKCPYCGHVVGHDASRCPCDICQMYREAQMGLEILDQMKRAKAKRIAEGVQQPNQTTRVTITGDKVVVWKSCGDCQAEISMEAKFCPRCGTAQPA